MLMSLRPLWFGSQSSLVINLGNRLGKVFACALLVACAPIVTAEAAVISVDSISIGAGEIWRADLAADVPVLPPSPLVIDTITLTISAGGVLDIQSNVVIVRLPNLQAIYDSLVNGYDGGTWAGH